MTAPAKKTMGGLCVETDVWSITKTGGVVMPGGNHQMKVTCWHRRWPQGACPGCYARLCAALQLIADEPARAKEVTDAVFAAMKAGGAP